MISIKNLSVAYDSNTPVLNQLNLSMQEHCVHGIVGLNGAGKTTLLNTIFGFIQADSGSIDYQNQPLTKKEICYLITENYFYSNITGREFLSLFKSNNFDENQWNELFHLPLDNIIDGYSTGMKKKLALLGMLKQDKPIIILDEPFNGLDIESCRIIRSILLKLKERGKIIIVTSHIIETLTNLCDYIHYLEKGQIKYSKTPTDFANFEQAIFKTIEEQHEDLIEVLLG